MNLTYAEARQIALSCLKSWEHTAAGELVLLDDQTIERSFGWVFFYTSKRYIETGDIRDCLAGNAPIVVTRADGRIHPTGTAHPVEHYLREFEGYQTGG